MTNKLSFEEWQIKVNSYVIRGCGMEIDDLPDYDYWNAWDAGDSPHKCAQDVIANAKECY